MSAQNFEAFLATIYVDKSARMKFLAEPLIEAKKYGLSPDEYELLKNMDRPGLEFAARSFEKKRAIKLRCTKKHFSIWPLSIFESKYNG